MFQGIHFVEIVNDFSLGRATQNGQLVHNGNLCDVVLQHVAESDPDNRRDDDVFLVHWLVDCFLATTGTFRHGTG